MTRIVSDSCRIVARIVSRIVFEPKPDSSDSFWGVTRTGARTRIHAHMHAPCVKVAKTLRTLRFELTNYPETLRVLRVWP